MYLKSLVQILLLLVSFNFFGQTKNKVTWKEIDQGLSLSKYSSPKQSILGDNTFTILKINPAYYNFNLFSAKQKGEKVRTAEEWSKDKNQIAVINAGMYQQDHATNLGYFKNYDFINNSRINRDNTIAAFNRKNESVPEFQIIDRTCQNWEELKDQYNSFTQSIRMVDCNQKNKWSQQNKKWSTVVIGKDKEGNALFIISRSPYTVHDFIDILLSTNLNLHNLMYLEGGPEASLYMNHNSTEVSVMGSYETGFNENDENDIFWRIPNVIGISKK